MTKSTKKTAKKTARAPGKAASKTTKRAAAKRSKKATTPRTSRERDPRLPAPGSTLTRDYKGRTIRVSVLQEGFRWKGNEYRSLSALAAAITGAKSINGFLWFKLTAGKRKSAPPAERSRKAKKARAPATETPAS